MSLGTEDIARKQAHMQQMLKGLWERSRPTVERRLQILAAAAGAAAGSSLPEELRSEAESEAHKLAGSLGMFGFTRGTELASEIESALAQSPPSGDLQQMVEALRENLLGHTTA